MADTGSGYFFSIAAFILLGIGLVAVVAIQVARAISGRLDQAEADRRNAEDRLTREKIFIDTAVNSLPGFFYVCDDQGRFLRWNRNAETITGYSSDEVAKLTPLDFFAGSDRDMIARNIRKVFEDKPLPSEADLISKDGKRTPYFFTGVRVTIDGRDYMVGMGLDITERKRTEEAVRIAHGQLLDIIESLPDPTFVIDRDKKVIAWNHAIEVLSGVTKTEMIGKGDYAYAVPFFGRKQPILIDLLDAPPREVDRAYKFVRREGDMIYAESYLPAVYQGKGAHLWGVAAPLYDQHGNRWGTIEVIRDVTDRVRAAERLRESEEKFRTLFETAGDAIFLMHAGRFIDCNARTLGMFGCRARDQIVGHAPGEFSPAVQPNGRDSFELAAEKINAALAGPPQFFEWMHAKLEGTPFPAEVSLNRVEVRGEVMLQAIVRDVTERKQAEAQVRELKNYLANIIDSMPSILVGVDRAGMITQWNKSAERTTGLAATDAVGQSLATRLPEFAPWIDTLRNKIKENGPASTENILLVKNGERRFYDLMLYPLIADGMEGSVVRIEDVTERTRIQELMVQTEKMISVGGLAAGMAHEINNPIGIIAQAAQNIERRVSPDLPANRNVAAELGLQLEAVKVYLDRRDIPAYLQDIRDASARAAKIVANMLQFSRKSEAVSQLASLAEILEKTVELAGNDFDLKKHYDFRSIGIVREYAPDLPMVPVIPVEMEQVVLNLLKNAAQAMTANPPERKPKITLRLRRESDYAVVEVEDNGPGMEETVRRRVFEPFFTTKKPGVGTGLGLSVSYMIITQNHKGLMSVDATPGVGARFTIKLPLTSEG